MDKLPVSIPVVTDVDGETYQARIEYTKTTGKNPTLNLSIKPRDRRKGVPRPFPISIQFEDGAGAFQFMGRAIAFLGKK